MSAPAVSVIVPTYNYGRFIEDALASVFAQTYRDFEVIVVDDGSTDDTERRVARFPEVRYLYQENSGSSSAAYDWGVAKARGRYIALLDADDVWLPHKLEAQMPALEGNGTVGLVCCGFESIDEAGRVLPQRTIPNEEPVQSLQGGIVGYPSTWLLPSDVYRRLGGVHQNGAARKVWDWDFQLRLLQRGFAIRSVPQCLARRRVHGGQEAGDPRLLLESKLHTIHRRSRGLAASSRGFHWRSMVYSAYLEAAVEHLALGRVVEAGRYFARAVRLQPDAIMHPATFFGILVGLNPDGSQTLPNTLRHLGERYAQAHWMLTAAVRQRVRRTAPDGPSLSTATASLGLGTCLLCLRAGAVADALYWFARTAGESPADTARVLLMVAQRRFARAPAQRRRARQRAA